MPTIYDLKEQAVTETPLLLFDCTLVSGETERWSTHGVEIEGLSYQGRVMSHNVFEMQAASEQGIDGVPQISITLANADSQLSEIERSIGIKGAQLRVDFVFYDFRQRTAASDKVTVFQGICNGPDDIREGTIRILASNRLNLQRVTVPQVRIQRRCPWEFPSNSEQRTEAVDGGDRGKYSRFYRCGYSPDIEGGSGSLINGSPYVTCGFTRTDCTARGMFERFGGIEFVPPQIAVRTTGDKNYHTSALAVNSARYNDYVPLVYGTAWYAPPVVFARNDGNLTRMEVLLGIGEMEGVLRVLVNDVEVPLGSPGADMTGTGWYNVPTIGTRTGAANPDFSDSSGRPAGDPYGGMAYLAIAVPNRLNDGSTLPRIKVLAQGLKLPIFDSTGQVIGERFTSNPSWILLDVLRRAGWRLTELDIPSFVRAAAYCDEPVEAFDPNGNVVTVTRFGCNTAVTNRRSAGDLARGIRNSARMLLTYGSGGQLQVRIENSLALEQPTKPPGTNSLEPLDGGWPAYEFGDGTNGFGGILRRADGSPSIRFFSRRTADTPNRLSVEFQDGLNQYQQDSYSLVDSEDVTRTGQDVSATFNALGISNYDQAGRLLRVGLNKSVRGNVYVEFDSSVKCVGLRPGDLITLTYLKDGYLRQPFRILKIAPGPNYRTSAITAQIHDDRWYSELDPQRWAGSVTGQSHSGKGIPRPLLGDATSQDGELVFGVEELGGSESEAELKVRVSYAPPRRPSTSRPGIPFIDLGARINEGGSLPAGEALYYAISANDSAGNESDLSFFVRARTNVSSTVTLTGLSFDRNSVSFNVYRGPSPAEMFRIAREQTIASVFVDAGRTREPISPPDANFDHANFYWRMEKLPETSADAFSENTIGSSHLELLEDAYRGSVVRITQGRGAGQERTVAANSGTSVNVSPSWTIIPDASSRFVVAESGWRFGGQTNTATAHFSIVNHPGEVVHISGRSANVDNVECAPELCTVTRWKIGGSGAVDLYRPPRPSFGLSPGRRGGTVELSGLSFSTLENTRSISAATLTLFYRDELDNSEVSELTADAGTSDEELLVAEPGWAAPGDFVQIDSEILRINEVPEGGSRIRVSRAQHTSIASTHNTAARLYRLKRRTAIAPFPADFFGSAYCGDWSYVVPMANARIASGELFATNSRGNSDKASICLTGTAERGLRTLSGGQYSIEVSGFLAIEHSAAPPLVIEAPHSVRDVFAALGKPADAPVRMQLHLDDSIYCELAVEPGASVSNTIDGAFLDPLRTGSRLTLSIVAVGSDQPGADLTVVIRL